MLKKRAKSSAVEVSVILHHPFIRKAKVTFVRNDQVIQNGQFYKRSEFFHSSGQLNVCIAGL